MQDIEYQSYFGWNQKPSYQPEYLPFKNYKQTFDSKEIYQQQECSNELYFEQSHLNPQFSYNRRSVESKMKNDTPYQYEWEDEAALDNVVSKNTRKVCEGHWRTKYDAYMENIGIGAENLLASFDITKRVILPSSTIYSSLWQDSSFLYPPPDVVDPWADPEFRNEDIPVDIEQETNYNYYDRRQYNDEFSSNFPNYKDAWEYDEYGSQTWAALYSSLDPEQIKTPNADKYPNEEFTRPLMET